MDPEALTIGFARRFATYKRATLFLRDQERLARILNEPHIRVRWEKVGYDAKVDYNPPAQPKP